MYTPRYSTGIVFIWFIYWSVYTLIAFWIFGNRNSNQGTEGSCDTPHRYSSSQIVSGKQWNRFFFLFQVDNPDWIFIHYQTFSPWNCNQFYGISLLSLWRSHLTKMSFTFCQRSENTLGHSYFCTSDRIGSLSSSSSSCSAGSMDIPDPLSPLFPIVYRLWQVFWTTSHILT